MMINKKIVFILSFIILYLTLSYSVKAQVIINEGSNRNYTTIPDEDYEYSDWIELYNNGNSPVSLHGYTLTDDINDTLKWQFPNITIPPGGFKIVFCSGKDRKPLTAFQQVAHITGYTPVIGWNTHTFSTPFLWDGLSNIIINICNLVTN